MGQPSIDDIEHELNQQDEGYERWRQEQLDMMDMPWWCAPSPVEPAAMIIIEYNFVGRRETRRKEFLSAEGADDWIDLYGDGIGEWVLHKESRKDNGEIEKEVIKKGKGKVRAG